MKSNTILKCLTDNGIHVAQTPNTVRKSINLNFGSGEKYELSKPAVSSENTKRIIWKDESKAGKVEELRFSHLHDARGNPLLSLGDVTYLSEIDSQIDELLSFYSE